MKHLNKRVVLLTAIALVLLLPLAAFAQTSQGRITGTVSDTSAAVIPGVDVVATNDDTGVANRAQTNEVGLYVLPFLQPGNYTITATSDGFKTYERSGVTVETSQVMELNLVMELGAVSETVTVTSEVPLLETSDATVGQFIDQRAVQDMPLANRRAMELVKMSSNAIFVSYSGDAKPQFAVAGGRGYKSTYMLDGGNIQNIRMASAQVDIDPPVEVIKEFRVVQNGYAAEFGGSASGVLISTTKSGTNSFHGSAFEYFRNDKLDAAGFFAPTQGDKKIKAPLRYNLFGGTVGGPIIKNKTHFFAGYEGTRKSDGSTQVMTVPTSAQRTGDFSQTTDKSGNLIPIYDPFSTRMVDGKNVRDPFPNNIIPNAQLDGSALGLTKYWPSPNKTPTNLTGAQNFSGNRARKFNRDNVTSRVDHAFSDANRFFFRFVYNKDPYSWTTNYPLEGIGDPQYPISPDRWETSYLFKDTHTISPTLIMDVGYSFSNRTWYANSAGLGSGVVDEIGLGGVSNEAFPEIKGTGMANLGDSGQRFQKPIQQHQITNSWTWVKNNHVFKFGGEMRYGKNFDINEVFITGRYDYNKTGTSQPGVSNTGYQFASYMLGWVQRYRLRATEDLSRHSYYFSWYAQDDWKVSNNLTLNIGMRWETDTSPVDAKNHSSSYDRYTMNPVSGTNGVVKFAGVGGWQESMYNNDYNNFGPRFGFAWKPFGSEKWVVRGGYGIFYEMPSTSANAATLGFERSTDISSPNNGITPAIMFQEGPDVSTAPPVLDDSFGAAPYGGKAFTSPTFYELSRETGYAHHVNFGIQRQLGTYMIEANYVGNWSRKLSNGTYQENQVLPSLMGPGNAQIRRPYPQFNNVGVLSSTAGTNNYHSGSVKFEKRLSSGLAFLSGYTFAKAIGDANNQQGNLGDDQLHQNIYDRRSNRGPDSLDIRHRFTFNATYDLPWGKGRRWLQEGTLSYIVGGWNVGAIVGVQTGGPFTVNMNSNTTNAFSPAQRANVLRDPNLDSGDRTVQQWFDTEAFEVTPAYTFGNAGRGIIRADGRTSVDLSLSKNFIIREQMNIQFRGDFLNAPNHPDFALPGRSLGGAGFGTIGSATQGRTIQLGARFNF